MLCYNITQIPPISGIIFGVQALNLPLSRALAVLAITCLSALGGAQAAPPKVVTTIAPLHSIASNVMQGLSSPKLLLKGNSSPHSYSMKPSEAKALAEADLILWVGPSLESFLTKAINSLGKKAKVIELLKEEDLFLLDARGSKKAPVPDPHLWLTTTNGEEIANILAAALAKMDPTNADTYMKNARAFRNKMDKVRRRLEVLLRSYATVPFMTYHDGFQYFERGFSLASKGFVTAHPERPIGANRVALLKGTIMSQKIQCLFVEPQVQPKLAQTLTEGTKARIATIDPLGAKIPLGVDMYGTLIKNLGQAFISCLSGKP